jgi:plasmid stabilization system protein ParE
MKLRVLIEPAARSELDERLAQLSLVNPTAARWLRNDVASLLDLITEFPEIYERYDANLRRVVLPRWSLGIFYEPTSLAIFVVAFLDLRRDPVAIRRRLRLHEDPSVYDSGSTSPSTPSGAG